MVRAAVLVSGGGTNLQAIIDAKRAGKIPSAELALVVASNASAYALTRAENAGIAHAVLRKEKGEAPENYGERLLTLLREDGIDLSPVYSDCGILLFGDTQDAHAGGSGCGCSAAVLCGPLLRDMHEGKIRRMIFAGTGAMMSPTSVQQSQPIAGICHAVVLERSGA